MGNDPIDYYEGRWLTFSWIQFTIIDADGVSYPFEIRNTGNTDPVHILSTEHNEFYMQFSAPYYFY